MFDHLIHRAPKKHTAEQQRELDSRTRHLALYQFDACPYCMKVRRAISRLGLHIEIRDTQIAPQHRADLIAGGGKTQVPCLRIEHEDGSVEWMYESDDIVAYLEKYFA